MKRLLREAKHRAFLAYKPYRFAVAGLLEPGFRAVHRVRPYRLDPQQWPGTHLPHDEPLLRTTTEPVPRRIFCFWTGPNPLTPNRTRGLERLRRLNPGLDVILVTPENLSAWILPEHPLSPSYEHLSLIHRSDYLRCYFLNFHGGGYADIKAARHSWTAAFDQLDASDSWMAGYRVPVRLMTPNDPNPALERAMRACSEIRLGQCAYIARPDTPLSREWWRELNRRVDSHAQELARTPGDAFGDNPGYPVGFTSLLAQVVDPLQVKYRDRLQYSDDLRPELDDYR